MIKYVMQIIPSNLNRTSNRHILALMLDSLDCLFVLLLLRTAVICNFLVLHKSYESFYGSFIIIIPDEADLTQTFFLILQKERERCAKLLRK